MKRTILSVVVVAMAVSACVQETRQEGDARQREEDRRELTVAPSVETPEARDAAALPTRLMEMEEAAKMARPSTASDMVFYAASQQGIVHPGRWVVQEQDRENYLAIQENGLQQVSQAPVSTFSVDVDTAAYSNVRRMLMREGRLPPHDAVRVEEFINYFDYQYSNPEGGAEPFSINTEIARTPWNRETHLLRVGLQGYKPAREQRPAANLVFLVDVSGSMRSQHKLALVKKSLRLLVNQLEARDRVALVVYAGAAGQVLPSTTGDRKATILAAIDQLEAGGSTNGGAGIQLAYSIAQQHLIDGGINRVLIASDGDMNVGTTSIDALKELVAARRETGIALTTLGYGTGNYNYSLMEQLADVGDGNAAYIDNLREAHKVLVKQMGSTLQTIARDVKIQVEFNPARVAEYRLIGYENRMLEREDFLNDKVDAGDIGVGHRVTALYEVALVDSAGAKYEPLRYQEESHSGQPPVNTDELAYVRLRFKAPGSKTSRELSRAVRYGEIRPSLEASGDDFRFAAAVAGYGQLLRGGKYTGDWGYPELLELARSARGRDDEGYRAELVALVELSRDLSVKPEA